MRFRINIPDSPKQVARRQERIAEERRKLRAKQQPTAPDDDYDFSPKYTIEKTPEEQAEYEDAGRILDEKVLAQGFLSALFDYMTGIAHEQGLNVQEYDPRPPEVLTVGQPFGCGFRFSNGSRFDVTCESLGDRRVKVTTPQGAEMVFNIPEDII